MVAHFEEVAVDCLLECENQKNLKVLLSLHFDKKY